MKSLNRLQAMAIRMPCRRARLALRRHVIDTPPSEQVAHAARAWCAGSGCSPGWAPFERAPDRRSRGRSPSRPPRLAGLLVMQPHGGDAEVDEDLGADAVLPAVDRQAELHVGVDRVAAVVLQLVGLQLVGDPDAPALVAPQVDDHAEAGLGDLGAWPPAAGRRSRSAATRTRRR